MAKKAKKEKRPVAKIDFRPYGAAIKGSRKNQNESRNKVGDEMYLSPRYLANIENKGQQPSLQVFLSWCPVITFPWTKFSMVKRKRKSPQIENLKRIAETSNFLTEHGITSYGELAEKCEAIATACDRIKSDLRDINAKMDKLSLKMKYAATYRQLRPVYDRYKTSRDKEKFLRGNESEIILFETAARELKRLGAVPLPTTESMKAEMDALAARKAELKAEQQQAQREERRYATIQQNVDEFLSTPAPEQQHQRKQELE